MFAPRSSGVATPQSLSGCLTVTLAVTETNNGSYPGQQLPAIGPIDPKQAQLLARPAQAAEQQPCPGRVRARSDRDHHGQDQPQGIHEQMPLSAVDLFDRVVAPLALDFRALDALAGPAPRSRVFMTTHGLPEPGPQCVVQTLPRATVAPLPKVVVDTLPIGLLAG